MDFPHVFYTSAVLHHEKWKIPSMVGKEGELVDHWNHLASQYDAEKTPFYFNVKATEHLKASIQDSLQRQTHLKPTT